MSLNELVSQKTRAVEKKTYRVKAEFLFTEEQLADPTPMTYTAKQLFDSLVESAPAEQQEVINRRIGV